MSIIGGSQIIFLHAAKTREGDSTRVLLSRVVIMIHDTNQNPLGNKVRVMPPHDLYVRPPKVTPGYTRALKAQGVPFLVALSLDLSDM